MYKRQLFVLGTALGGRLGSVTPLGILVLLYLAFICGAGYLLWACLLYTSAMNGKSKALSALFQRVRAGVSRADGRA